MERQQEEEIGLFKFADLNPVQKEIVIRRRAHEVYLMRTQNRKIVDRSHAIEILKNKLNKNSPTVEEIRLKTEDVRRDRLDDEERRGITKESLAKSDWFRAENELVDRPDSFVTLPKAEWDTLRPFVATEHIRRRASLIRRHLGLPVNVA